MARVGAVLLVAVAACGGRVAPPGAAPSVEVAAPAPAPARPDPLSEASLVADVAWLTAPERRGRGAATEEAVATAQWIAAELRAAGYKPRAQAIPQMPGQHNVIAVYEPTAALPTTVVVMAHYDHLGVQGGAIYPGADDNASGVAAALAVARDVAAKRDVAGRVIFVFTGAEEPGLLGAEAYADAPVHPLADTRVVINLDMVGRKLFESALDRDAALGAIGLTGALVAEADAAAAVAGLQLLTASPLMVRLIGQDWRSDDWVFRDRGIPAVHLSTGLHDDYHKPTDTLEHMSRPQLVRITRFLRELVARVAR